MKSLTISEVITKSDTSDNPIIVDFDNGTLVPRKGIKRKVEISNNSKDKSKVVRITTDDGYGYTGSERNDDSFRNFLLVRKKHSKQAKLIEISFATLRSDNLIKKPEVTVEVAQDFGERSAALKKMFGGKKAIRRLDQSEKINSTINATADDSLKNVIDSISVTKQEPTASELLTVSLDKIIPPSNKDAKDVSQIYLLQNIVGNKLLEDCKDEFENYLCTNPDEFVKQLNPDLQQLGEAILSAKTAQYLRAVALLFLDSIIKYCKIRIKDFRPNSAQLGQYQPINEAVVDMFSIRVGKNYTRPLSMKDKSMCYMIVFYFIANPFEVPLDKLAQQCNFGLKKLSTLCKLVGGVPVAKGSHTYQLKYPLPPPKPEFRRRK